MEQEEGIHLIVIAVVGDILTAIVKLIAGLLCRSQALLAEGVHSVVDVINQILLLVGLRHDEDTPDEKHPFGQGQAKFYWAFVISIFVFGMASIPPLVNGMAQIIDPQPLSDFGLTYLVLLSSLSFQLVSLSLSSGLFLRGIKGIRGFLHRLEYTKDLATATVWLEDTMAIFGIGIATAGIVLSQIFDSTIYDGIASVLIGVLLIFTGYLLANDTKQILLNQTISPQLYEQIVEKIEAFPAVQDILDLDSMYLGKEKILLRVSLQLADDVEKKEQKAVVREIKKKLKQDMGSVKKVFIVAR